MNQKTIDLKPMGIGDVLDYSIEVFKSNFKTLALLTLILYLPWVFIESLINGSVLGTNANLFGNMLKHILEGDYNGYLDEIGTYGSDSFSMSILSNMTSFLNMCYGITIKLVYNAAIIKIAYDYAVKNQKQDSSFNNVKNNIKEGFGFMPRMMGNAFFFNLIVLGTYYISIFAAIFVIFFALIFSVNLSFDQLSAGVLIVFYIMLFALLILAALVCTAFFWVKLVFGANAVVCENASVFDSLKRSWNLSKGYFWQTGLICLFGFILFFVSGSMLTAASLFVSTISKALFVLLYTVTNILNGFLYPFIMIFITLAFINIKIKKEGLDLEVKVQSMFQKQFEVNNSVNYNVGYNANNNANYNAGGEYFND